MTTKSKKLAKREHRQKMKAIRMQNKAKKKNNVPTKI